MCGNKKPVIAESRLWYKTLQEGVDSTSSLVNLNVLGCVVLLVHNARWGSSVRVQGAATTYASQAGKSRWWRMPLRKAVFFSVLRISIEHLVRTRVSRAHEDPEALAGEAVKDDARIAGREERGRLSKGFIYFN